MSEFQTFRASELANVGTIGNSYNLKIMGTDGESKWLTITSTELEKIIEILEPEDYSRVLKGDI